jgi:hypothetical protein
MAGHAAPASIPVCHAQGSTWLVRHIAVSILILLTIFKQGDGKIFLQLKETCHI